MSASSFRADLLVGHVAKVCGWYQRYRRVILPVDGGYLIA